MNIKLILFFCFVFLFCALVDCYDNPDNREDGYGRRGNEIGRRSRGRRHRGHPREEEDEEEKEMDLPLHRWDDAFRYEERRPIYRSGRRQRLQNYATVSKNTGLLRKVGPVKGGMSFGTFQAIHKASTDPMEVDDPRNIFKEGAEEEGTAAFLADVKSGPNVKNYNSLSKNDPFDDMSRTFVPLAANRPKRRSVGSHHKRSKRSTSSGKRSRSRSKRRHNDDDGEEQDYDTRHHRGKKSKYGHGHPDYDPEGTWAGDLLHGAGHGLLGDWYSYDEREPDYWKQYHENSNAVTNYMQGGKRSRSKRRHNDDDEELDVETRHHGVNPEDLGGGDNSFEDFIFGGHVFLGYDTRTPEEEERDWKRYHNSGRTVSNYKLGGKRSRSKRRHKDDDEEELDVGTRHRGVNSEDLGGGDFRRDDSILGMYGNVAYETRTPEEEARDWKRYHNSGRAVSNYKLGGKRSRSKRRHKDDDEEELDVGTRHRGVNSEDLGGGDYRRDDSILGMYGNVGYESRTPEEETRDWKRYHNNDY